MGLLQRKARQYSDKAVRMGWLMYDWANGAYFLVITTAIFPIFYNAITATEGADGNVSDKVMFLGREFINTQLYSYVLGASFLIVIIASPLLSGMADYLGRKLLFLKMFCYMGAMGCIGLFWFDPQHLEWSMTALFMANVGAWGAWASTMPSSRKSPRAKTTTCSPPRDTPGDSLAPSSSSCSALPSSWASETI